MWESISLRWWIISVWTVYFSLSHPTTNVVFQCSWMSIQTTRYRDLWCWFNISRLEIPCHHVLFLHILAWSSKNVRLTVTTKSTFEHSILGHVLWNISRWLRFSSTVCCIGIVWKRDQKGEVFLDELLLSHQHTRNKVGKHYIHTDKYGSKNCHFKFVRI